MELPLSILVGILLLVGVYLIARQQARRVSMPAPEVEESPMLWHWSEPPSERTFIKSATGSMTKNQLLEVVRTKFFIVGVPEETVKNREATEVGTLAHWAVPVFDLRGGILDRQWVKFYVDQDGVAYWQDREPKPDPVPVPDSFGTKVEKAVGAKLADGTLKYASVDSISEPFRRALTTIMVTGGTTFRKAIISADAQDRFTVEVI